MKKAFMDEDFLLYTETAGELFHTCAKSLPIVDYHCHISPEEIARDRKFDNLAEIWLGGDHYKWRFMRANGIEERFITGDASDWEKFFKWAGVLERGIGNPLYTWSHMELKRYFGYGGVLNERTAGEVWELGKERLSWPSMSARGLILQSKVTHLCTTDDPADSLKWHQVLREDREFPVQVLPAWRPDQALSVEKPSFLSYLERLGEAAGMEIGSVVSLKEALVRRMDVFEDMGCLASDHGLSHVMYVPASEEKLEQIFEKRLLHKELSREETEQYKTGLLLFLAEQYAEGGWVMQLHYGCSRDNNRQMYERLGPDTGFDCIGPETPAEQLIGFLDALHSRGALPKTILYSLNPHDNERIDSVIGCFQTSECPSKLQHGAAWWFNDHRQGIRNHLISLASIGCLGTFVGMLTDSRSFLSYTRHEYFRRILCDLLGQWAEDGEFPDDRAVLEKLVSDISYHNAIRYFGFTESGKTGCNP